VPVALVTGSADVTPTDHGLADAYLQKPFTIEALLKTVHRLAAR
jgi:CheY-like chemotaxis protein